MARLEKLEEELYLEEGKEDLEKRMKRRVFYPGTLKKFPTSWFGRERKIAGAEEPKLPVLKWFLMGLTAVIIIGGSLFIYLYLGTRGSEIELSIHGRERLESGEAVTIPISYKNVSGDTMKEVEIAIILSKDTLVRDQDGLERPAPPRFIKKLEDIGPRETRSTEVIARFFGHEGEEKTIEAVILYRPERLRARFSTRISKNLWIDHVPLAITWEVPELLTNGQEVTVKIRYTSNGRAPFHDLVLRFDSPVGFTLSSSTPAPSIGKNFWNVGTIEPGEEGIITLRGAIAGEEGEIKAFRGGLGKLNPGTREWVAYAEASQEVKMAINPISILGFLDGVRDKKINPGDRIRFTLKYKNNTASVLRNVSVRAFLESGPVTAFMGTSTKNLFLGTPQNLLDLATLGIERGGAFDSRVRAMVWTPGSSSELREVKPGEEGEFTFNLDARSQPSVKTEQDKNWIVKLRSTVDVATIPQELAGTDLSLEDTLQFKVRSKIIFSGKSLYRSSSILNSGPIPPQVGKKTTYTILWETRNFSNDLDGAEIVIPLHPNAKWEGVVTPQDARISYDGASGDVRWKIGEIRAGTGVIRPALVGGFMVSVVPSEADVGKVISLVGESRLSAKDTFTGEVIEEKQGALTTEVRYDSAVSPTGWRAVK